MPEPHQPPTSSHSHGTLAAVVTPSGAVLLGLGSIVGTGVFVSIGIAAGIAGEWVLVAVALAAVVAAFNGLSSAQLAANHPVSGGTYEYGYRYLNPTLGFVAGWMFLCAKSASAATAALGASGYLLSMFGVSDPQMRTALAVLMVVVLTLLVSGGMGRSSRVNALMVTLTTLSLAAFAALGVSALLTRGPSSALTVPSVLPGGLDSFEGSHLLHATALMFVAYTGYGRIATLGEEVHEPRKTIPRAIVTTLVCTATLYLVVGAVAVGVVGSTKLAALTESTAAPLEAIARQLGSTTVAAMVGVGAITAMAGVVLNLLLGLSRVALAMGRRGDLPRGLAVISPQTSSPGAAVVFVGVLVAGLTMLGSAKATWSFSAFTVLIYYSLTNLSALRLTPVERLYPRWVSMAGLGCCVGLAFWVEPRVWLTGIVLLAIGLVGRRLFKTR